MKKIQQLFWFSIIFSSIISIASSEKTLSKETAENLKITLEQQRKKHPRVYRDSLDNLISQKEKEESTKSLFEDTYNECFPLNRSKKTKDSSLRKLLAKKRFADECEKINARRRLWSKIQRNTSKVSSDALTVPYRPQEERPESPVGGLTAISPSQKFFEESTKPQEQGSRIQGPKSLLSNNSEVLLINLVPSRSQNCEITKLLNFTEVAMAAVSKFSLLAQRTQKLSGISE